MKPPRFLHQCLWLRVFCLDDEGRIKSSCRLFHCWNICLHSLVCTCLKLSPSIIFGTTSQSLDWTVLTSDYLFAPVMLLWIPCCLFPSWNEPTSHFFPLLKWLNLIKDERGGVFESSYSAVFENIFFFLSCCVSQVVVLHELNLETDSLGSDFISYWLSMFFILLRYSSASQRFTHIKCLKGRSLHAHILHWGVIDSSQIKNIY